MEIVKEFDSTKSLLSDFGESINQLIKSLLVSYRAKPHQLTFRIKDRDSLEKKLLRKNNKYESLSEITDLIGFRIVTYFEDDIDTVANLFEQEFVIDILNSIDKRKLETDKFGYRSLHYVFSLKSDRLSLTEYKRFSNIKAEVQIRSILQHSWAEIEHDLGYKGESEIPESARRTFFRVAALLEQADIEFVKLRGQILQHVQSVKEQIQASPELVLIDKSSVRGFIEENQLLREVEDEVLKTVPNRDAPTDYIFDSILPRFEKLGIKSIKELENAYATNKGKLIPYLLSEVERYKATYNKDPEKFAAGASLIWLCLILDPQKDSTSSES